MAGKRSKAAEEASSDGLDPTPEKSSRKRARKTSGLIAQHEHDWGLEWIAL